MAQMLFDPDEPDEPDEDAAEAGVDAVAEDAAADDEAASPLADLSAALGAVDGLDADAVLEQAGAGQRLVNLAQAMQLKLAARWADLNTVLDDSQSVGLPGMERLVRPGGDGTPWVAEFAAAELAAQLGVGPVAGDYLIGDALDLRHRLPALWALVCEGEVRVFAARRIAQATHHLSAAAAAKVDATAARYATTVGSGRLQTLVEAAVIAADPDAAQQRADAARDSHGVWVGRDSEAGTKTVFARAAAPDLDALDARISQIADTLAEFGDTDPVDLRRAKALAVLSADDPTARLHTVIDTLTTQTAQTADNGGDGSADDLGRAGEAAAEEQPTPKAAKRPRRRRPSAGKAVLYIHLSEQALRGRYAVARVEDLGPVVASQVQDFLKHRHVVVKPVIDLNRPTRAADGYEVPADIAETVYLRCPADCYPYATSTSRRRGDLDHTQPYVSPDEGGPPGQTRTDNLGRLSRLQHRIKTHGQWKVKQLRSGLWLWASPHHYHYLVDHTGTIPLGKL